MSEMQQESLKEQTTDNCITKSKAQETSLEQLQSEIEKLDQDSLNHLLNHVCVRLEKEEVFYGPIPSPKTLKDYKRVLPDAPERILQMAERQQAMAEREQQETWDERRRILNINAFSMLLGQGMSFLICIGVLWLGYQLISTGKTGEGLAAIITAGAAMAGIFIYTKVTKQKDQD